MQTLHELYVQNPFWVWLAICAVFIGLDISIGSGKLVWVGAVAGALAFINLAGVRLGPLVELPLFLVVALGGVLLALVPWRPRPSAATPHDDHGRSAESRREFDVAKAVFPMADERRTARLIGRIGRTTSDFSNGVGRVWIDGAEWGAELNGEETLPSNTPVRVLGVTGGVRLHVQNLMIG